MALPTKFIPARDQDAWFVLRGFRYQVDRSILRWISLEAGEHLELESGEDIDLIWQAFETESAEEESRLLEQVKVRTGGMTLRRDSALESLANAAKQLMANPNIALKFCFTTNAPVARERPCPFPDKTPGIALWEQLRTDQIKIGTARDAVVHIRRFLSQANKPKKVNETVWQSLIDLTNGAEEDFAKFVRLFEWNCAGPGMDELSNRVRQTLRSRSGIIDDAQLNELYQRLFLYVFQLLTKNGLKRLTRDDLECQFNAPTLSQTDHAVLVRLDCCFFRLEHRVDQMEDTVNSLSCEVENLGRQHGIAADFDMASHLSLESPPLVTQLAARADTVSDLTGQMSNKHWLALFGSVDTGKSHLCALASDAFGGCGAWIRFSHSMSNAQASTVLREAIRILSGETQAKSSGSLFLMACRRIGSGRCLVLDDLPRLDGSERLVESLGQLLRACLDLNVTILSASQHRLPHGLTSLIGSVELLEIPVPVFSEAETKEVLANSFAPDRLLSQSSIRFINGLTNGHPLLITLVGQFLREKNWQFTDQELDALIRGDHTVGISDEVVSRLCQSMDSSQRELLYRLSLAAGSLKDSVALQLANVAPEVDRPRESLTHLLGAWVQRDAREEVSVSPLVRGTGTDNLNKTTREQCYVTLAESVTKATMGPWDAQMAIGYFVNGRQFERAGILFLMLLDQLRVRETEPQVASVLSMWAEQPLPTEMDLGLRVKIRAMQFAVFPKYGKSDRAVLADLDKLIANTTEKETMSVHFAATLAVLTLSSRDCLRTIEYLSRSFQLLENSDVERSALMVPDGKDAVEILWTVILNVTTFAHLQAWISAFESLRSSDQTLVTNSKEATVGCIVLADRLLLVEMRKPPNEQEWIAALDGILWLQDKAGEIGWRHLSASALKARVNIYGEFLKNLDECEPDVRAFMGDHSQPDLGKSLVGGMYGRMLTGSGRHEEALPWLNEAIQLGSSAVDRDQMMTLLAAARSSAERNRRAAVEYAERAARIAREGSKVLDVEAAKAFGELATAIILQNPTREGAIRAYPVWSEAADRMLVYAERDDDWKDTLVLFGHTQSYLLSWATTEAPPDTAADGGPYAAPHQGMFFTTVPERIEYYQEESVPALIWLMSHYSRAAGDTESADDWAMRAVEAIDNVPETHVTMSIKKEIIPDLLCANKFADALDAGVRGAESMVAAAEVGESSGRALPHNMPLVDLVNRLSTGGRQTADRFAVISAIVPALLRIGYIAMADRDKAKEIAAELAAMCRQIAPLAADEQFFRGSAEVLQHVSDESSMKTMLDVAHSFDTPEYNELRLLGYLASTLNADPASAFKAQLVSMQTIWMWYPPDTAMHEKLLVPYIESFWKTTFAVSRFQFRSPSLVEKDLAKSCTANVRFKVREILRAVQHGFRERGVDEAIYWLNDDLRDK